MAGIHVALSITRYNPLAGNYVVGCPGGEQALGGGAEAFVVAGGRETPITQLVLVRSVPLLNPARTIATGWEAQFGVLVDQLPLDVHIKVYAICAPIVPS